MGVRISVLQSSQFLEPVGDAGVTNLEDRSEKEVKLNELFLFLPLFSSGKPNFHRMAGSHSNRSEGGTYWESPSGLALVWTISIKAFVNGKNDDRHCSGTSCRIFQNNNSYDETTKTALKARCDGGTGV